MTAPASPQAAAEEAVRAAFACYMQWQPDGDWKTFLDFVGDEGGIRPRVASPPAETPAPSERADHPMDPALDDHYEAPSPA